MLEVLKHRMLQMAKDKANVSLETLKVYHCMYDIFVSMFDCLVFCLYVVLLGVSLGLL